MSERPDAPKQTTIVEVPIQLDEPQPLPPLPDVSALIRVHQAREAFQVDATGLSVAILDTGLRTTHADFAGRVRAQVRSSVALTEQERATLTSLLGVSIGKTVGVEG